MDAALLPINVLGQKKGMLEARLICGEFMATLCPS